MTRAFGFGRPQGFTRTSGGDRSAQALGNEFSLLTSGEEVLPRDLVTSEYPLTSGTVMFSYFTARKTESISQIQTEVYTTAGATLTIARIGIYVPAAGTLTLVASSVNDTAMWTAANTPYPKALSAPWAKVAGTRYAFAAIAVGTTMPTLGAIGIRYQTGANAPRVQGELAAQANLPASTPESGLASGHRRLQALMLP